MARHRFFNNIMIVIIRENNIDFLYIEKLVGIDHVAFGPDTLFGDHVALHKVFRDYLSITRQEEDLPPYPRVECRWFRESCRVCEYNKMAC